jgi:hypothetical protein
MAQQGGAYPRKGGRNWMKKVKMVRKFSDLQHYRHPHDNHHNNNNNNNNKYIIYVLTSHSSGRK